MGQTRPKRARDGYVALIFDAEPCIDLLLPLVACEDVIAPWPALAIACHVLKGFETLARSEHVRTRLAETIRAERSQAVLPTEPRVRLAEDLY